MLKEQARDYTDSQDKNLISIFAIMSNMCMPIELNNPFSYFRDKMTNRKATAFLIILPLILRHFSTLHSPQLYIRH